MEGVMSGLSMGEVVRVARSRIGDDGAMVGPRPLREVIDKTERHHF